MEASQTNTQLSSKASSHQELSSDKNPSTTEPIETTGNSIEKTDEGGWGVLIVASVFMANFSLLGWFQTQSFFFIEWQREFNTTSVQASLLVSIGLVILGIASPIGSILATVFGNRKVVMVGGMFVASGMIGTMLSDSMVEIIFTWGVMIGIGLGLVYSPSVVMIGQYFDKHFTLANGIAYAGGSMGQIFIPLLSGNLIDAYGWRGAVWLLSAIMSHLVVGGAVLRPKRKRQNAKELHKTKQMQLSSNAHDNTAFQSDIEIEMTRIPTNATEIDTTISVQNHSEANDSRTSNDIKNNMAESLKNSNAYNNKASRGDTKIELLSVTKIASPRYDPDETNSLHSTSTIQNDEMYIPKHQRVIWEENDTKGAKYRHNSSRPKLDSSIALPADSRNNTNGKESSPKDDSDIEKNADRESNDNTLNIEGNSCKSVVKILTSNICFILLLNVFFIMGFIFFTPVAHAIPRALASGIEEHKASLLPTIFGIGSLVGRLGPSFMTDCFSIPRDVINVAGFVICTIGNILNPFFPNYVFHVVYHLIYGGATGTLTVFTFTLIQIVIQKEHRVFGVGLATFFLMMGDATGSLLAGWLVDVTGSYDIGSWLLSCLSSVGTILLLIVAFIIRRKKAEGQYDAEPVELETMQ
ncbi:uncharacterized protein [Amphiura filiformis]|uniref:uncharacterized protein n=1 Tax=Amphiura filiformis TaxID=82378 RepID=UPI003B21012D